MTALSVVIPLYNKATHIGRTLRSVLAQTAPPDEILVVDDGSTDGGWEVVESFDAFRIKLIRQPNHGVSRARNQGVEESRGELIAFLDADDVWKPGFLAAIGNLRRQFPQAGAYATNYEIVKPNGKKYNPNFNIFPEGTMEGLICNYVKTTILNNFVQPVWTSAVVIPKRILQEIGGFRESANRDEDIDVWLRIALRYPIAWTKEAMAIYHMDAENRVSGVIRFTGEPVISRTVREAIQSGMAPPEQIEGLREFAARFELDVVPHCLFAGKRRMAIKLLKACRGTRRLAWEWRKWRLLSLLPGNLGLLVFEFHQTLMNRSPAFVRLYRYLKKSLRISIL